MRIKQIYTLEKLFVLPRPDAADLMIDLRGEAREFVFHRDAFAVGVEADENKLAAPVHDHIVIAIVLVLHFIPLVRVLVGLDADQRVIDAQAVVDFSPMRAITVGRVYWCVVAKIFEMFVQICTSLQLLEPVRFHPWVVWKQMLEARRAKTVVIPVTTTRVYSIYAVRAFGTASVFDTAPKAVSFALSITCAAWFRT